jgi:hypothetical protein
LRVAGSDRCSERPYCSRTRRNAARPGWLAPYARTRDTIAGSLGECPARSAPHRESVRAAMHESAPSCAPLSTGNSCTRPCAAPVTHWSITTYGRVLVAVTNASRRDTTPGPTRTDTGRGRSPSRTGPSERGVSLSAAVGGAHRETARDRGRKDSRFTIFTIAYLGICRAYDCRHPLPAIAPYRGMAVVVVLPTTATGSALGVVVVVAVHSNRLSASRATR